MNTFTLQNGWSAYFYVQHTNSPRFPYGICGPFATEEEAEAAIKRIEAAFPAVDFHLERAGFADDQREMLAKDNAHARQRLEQLAA